MAEERMRVIDGLTVLVVEDEALVALNIESILEDMGCRVVGPVMRLDRLDELIGAGVEADAAILDVNIAGEEIYPYAGRLVAAGLPIVFATGYGRSGVPEAWRSRPIVQKPYTPDDIARALAQAAARQVASGADHSTVARRND